MISELLWAVAAVCRVAERMDVLADAAVGLPAGTAEGVEAVDSAEPALTVVTAVSTDSADSVGTEAAAGIAVLA